MLNLQIKRTTQTPEVSLNSETGTLKFRGRSLPEDATFFYSSIFEWLDEYVNYLAEKTEAYIELDYFNTSSAKAILSIFIKLEELHRQNHPVNINWIHEEDDEDMRELGEEYQDLFKVPIKLVSRTHD